MSIFKACDIRGRYGEELCDEHACRLGLALAEYCGTTDVVIGGDGRTSTPALLAHLASALTVTGCRVVNLGIVPTPALYFARRQLGISVGVMVTASHNPAADNGFKLSLGALPVTPDDIVALAHIMNSVPADRVQSVLRAHAPPAGQRRVDILPDYTDYARSQSKPLNGMRVIVDCANGAASRVARHVWEQTGARVSYLFDDVDGTFPNHAPDPSNSANLSALCKQVVSQNADLGIAYDGDGDRVVFVDHLGRPLSGDRAIVLFACEALRAGPAPVVYDQKCSLIVPEAIRSAGGEPIIERSGHTFIKTAFLKNSAPYAGEISGHHFFRKLQGDDGVIASLYMAGLLQDSGSTLAELADAIEVYPITPDIRLKMDSSTANRVLDNLERRLAGEARFVKLDGLRAEFADGWGIARLSVTEPAMTFRFEGRDKAALVRVIQRFEHAAPDLQGRLPDTAALPV